MKGHRDWRDSSLGRVLTVCKRPWVWSPAPSEQGLVAFRRGSQEAQNKISSLATQQVGGQPGLQETLSQKQDRKIKSKLDPVLKTRQKNKTHKKTLQDPYHISVEVLEIVASGFIF